MTLGKNILELRRSKNITQEELAADLGVTAAAVSKWENGYTLPDILMLCALADHFSVSTDALLGRNVNSKCAVILADDLALGEKMADLVKKFHFDNHGIFTDKAAALAAAEEDPRIDYLIVGAYNGDFLDDCPLQKIVSCHPSDDEVLSGLRWALENCMDEDSRINILT